MQSIMVFVAKWNFADIINVVPQLHKPNVAHIELVLELILEVIVCVDENLFLAECECQWKLLTWNPQQKVDTKEKKRKQKAIRFYLETRIKITR